MSVKECAVFKKAVVFRVVSFISTLLAARVWFGDWHITPFAIFLIPYCTLVYYLFEKFWAGVTSR